MLDFECWPCINHIPAQCGHREYDRGSAWNHLGSAMPQGPRMGLVLPSGSCTHLSVRECQVSHSSPHYQKCILIQSKNQMYRALGVGYKIVRR